MTQSWQVVPTGMPETLTSSRMPPAMPAYLTSMCMSAFVVWTFSQCRADELAAGS